jgi:60S ribosome subunit biogenesis protein NIP7
MRPLTEEETKSFFEKLSKYIGRNIRLLIDREDGEFCFRFHKNRIYYCSLQILKASQCIPTDNLHSFGTCFAKLTHSGKIRLTITCLDYLHQYAKHRLWIKPNGEMSYLYGNHVLKPHVGRMTENTPKYQNVVIMNMGDLPLGFGVAAMSTTEVRKADSNSIVAFHQADVGEYLRTEEEMF